jgi:uncharacterized protein (DUF1501 family)
MVMTRRDLLRLGVIGAAHPLLPVRGIVSRAFAAPGAGSAKFLLVFLRGGYDAANVVIPVGSDFYYQVRPTIAVPRPNPADANAAVPLTGSNANGWALHPALAPSVMPLWSRRQLAFVPFAGTPDLTRSHFETQDSIESGMPVSGASGKGAAARSFGSGFLNRLVAALDGKAVPVSFTDGLPTAMTGDIVVPNVSLKGSGRPPFDDTQMALLGQMYAGTRFEAAITDGFDVRKAAAQEVEKMEAEMQAANRNAITARGFELEARRMAGLMRDRFDIGFIDVGGWDTHVNQGAAQGQLATLLASLGEGLAAFASEMGGAWDRSVVFVLSEFGRTFRENGTRGTDHGHGSVHWVLGGAVGGGCLAGDQVAVTEATLNQNRDFPVLTEYRALLGGVFQRMYGLGRDRLARVFPDAVPADLKLL